MLHTQHPQIIRIPGTPADNFAYICKTMAFRKYGTARNQVAQSSYCGITVLDGFEWIIVIIMRYDVRGIGDIDKE